MPHPTKPACKFLLYFLPCLLTSLAFLIYPVYVIRPFRAQGARELMAALAILRFRPAVMALCAVVSLAALVWYWLRERSRLPRAFSAVSVLVVSAAALLSRVNIYELMFHPLEHPSFTTAGATKLDGGEKVIAVKLNGIARAYPIRSMSYHHVVNDVLGGVGIAATY